MIRGLALVTCAIALSAASPGIHKVVRDSADLEFSYEWPAEAVAIPALDLRFYHDARRKLAEARKDAADDTRPSRKHQISQQWTTAGMSPRILSLRGDMGWDTGGAHPNHGTEALLWDRRLGRAVSADRLFAARGQFSSLTRDSYCGKLDAERRVRREGEGPGLIIADDPFDKCPTYAELAIYLSDENRNGRFDRIVFVASPYVAGPYVEGEYEIALPLTARLIAAMRPEYRSSFEAQRQ